MSEILEKGLYEALELIKKEGIARLIAQGHNASGEAIASIKNQVDKIGQDYVGKGTGLHYLLAQETGVKPFVNRQSTGGYIQGLIDWINNKGIVAKISSVNGKPISPSRRNAKSMAYAIAKTHYLKGMHTRDGKFAPQYQGWLSSTIDNNKSEITEIIRKTGYKFFDTIIKTAINEEKRNIA